MLSRSAEVETMGARELSPGVLYLGAVLLLGANSEPVVGQDDGGFVKPGQTLSDLRRQEPEEEAVSSREGWSVGGAPLRQLALTVAILGAVGGLVVFGRRRRLHLKTRGQGGRMEIVDKLALSSRHWICVVRVDGKRLVIGISGDNLSSLAVLDDGVPGTSKGREVAVRAADRPAGALYRTDRKGPDTENERSREVTGVSSQGDAAKQRQGTFWFRPQESPASAADESWENDLAPYRREVNRLRATLQSWRQTSEGRERADDGVAEDRER